MLKPACESQILLQPDKSKVVLLVHGFRLSPDNFSELSQALYHNGFSVYNIRLPGHGTRNEDSIFTIKAHNWETYVNNIFFDLSRTYNEVYAAGFSLGAGLLLNIQAQFKAFEKMVLYCPLIGFSPFQSLVIQVIRFLKKRHKNVPMDCSVNNCEPAGYLSFLPIPQIHEIYKLSRKVKHNLSKHSHNILCFLGKNDHVFDYEMLKKILQNKTNASIYTLNKSYHNQLLDVEKNIVIEETINWLKK